MARTPTFWTADPRWIDESAHLFGREFRDLMRNVEAQRAAPPSAATARNTPPVDIAETRDALEIAIELPGVAETEVRLTLDHQRLIIAGDKRDESEHGDRNWHVVERHYGSFQRSIALPFEPAADAVDARFDRGVLRITVRKPSEVVQKSKDIPIRPST